MGHLEQQYEKPVLIVANRTIISPQAKHHASQMRPRSRCLKTVHNEVLIDVCFPSNLAGRSWRANLTLSPIATTNSPPTRSLSVSPSHPSSKRRSLSKDNPSEFSQ